MPKPYNDYKLPVYSEDFGNKGTAELASAFNYAPKVYQSSDFPQIDALGIHAAGDCIGILARDPKTQTILVYHMKSLDSRGLACGLLAFLIKAGKVPDEDINKLKELIVSIYDFGHVNQPTLEITNAFNYIRENGSLKDISFVLNNSHPEDIPKLLEMLHSIGVQKDNIVVDIDTSQMLMDRKTGKLCINFDYEKTKKTHVKNENQIEDEKNIVLLRQQRSEKITLLIKMTPAEKFNFLSNQGMIQIKNDLVSFQLTWEFQDLFNALPTTFFDQVLDFAAQQKNLHGFEFKFYTGQGSTKYMTLPTLLINKLKEYPHITTLIISTTEKSKTCYLSMYSKEAGIALKENGKNLQHLDIVANTEGRTAFENAAESLHLQSCSIQPIDNPNNKFEI